MTKKKIILWSIATLAVLILAVVAFGAWFLGLVKPLPGENINFKQTTVADLPYLSEDKIPVRGKILAVVTSMDSMGTSGKRTGFELTELSRAYYVFEANGYEVDIASPAGGTPPMIVDDLGPYDYAFLNDPLAQQKLASSLRVAELEASDYDAIFFAGGKGTMWDFPNNVAIQNLVKQIIENDGVVGAVCHGPAALVNVQLEDGRYLLQGKEVSGFTNAEELLLISDAREIFPFLLQDKLIEQGAQFREGTMYLNTIAVDENLVTGQNPWSTWAMAEAMITQLGHTPKTRQRTAEEVAVTVIEALHTKGEESAKALVKTYIDEGIPVSRELIAVHSIMAAIQWELSRAIDILQVLRYAHSYLEGKL